MVASEGRQIARNSVLLGAGDAAAMALGFVTTIFVTDLLGQEGYGLLLGAQRFVLFLLVIAHFGLHPLMVRTMAAGKDEPGAVLGTFLTLRAGFGAAFVASVAIAASVLDYMPDHRWLLFAVAGMELVGTFSQLLMAVCEGRERMARSALIVLSRAIFLFAGVIWVALTDGDLVSIVIVYGIGRCCELIAAVLIAPGAAPGLRLRVRRDLLGPTARQAVPFVVIGLAFMAMRTIDVTMLARFSSVEETSRYGAALNFTDVFLVVPLLVQRALLPAFSRLQATGSGADVARDTMVAFSAVLVPTAVALACLADSAVALYPSGQFADAARVLEILALALLVHGPMTVCATFLTGSGRLWAIVASYLLALPLQAVLNFQLIGPYGAEGVAIGTAAGTLVLTIVLLVVARPIGLRVPALAIARHLFAASVMGAALFPLRHEFLLVPVAVGLLVYNGVLWAVTPSDSLEQRLLAELRERLSRR